MLVRPSQPDPLDQHFSAYVSGHDRDTDVLTTEHCFLAPLLHMCFVLNERDVLTTPAQT